MRIQRVALNITLIVPNMFPPRSEGNRELDPGFFKTEYTPAHM